MATVLFAMSVPPIVAVPVPGQYLTTTGVGHPHPGLPFPKKPMKWRYLDGLPTALSSGCGLNVGDVYQSTCMHSYRKRAATLPAPHIHKKAPASWKVHYTMHTIQKCDGRKWCPALNMGNQSSEMKAQFQGRSDNIIKRLPDSSHDQPLPHTLRDHLNDGPTKELPGSTVNRAGQGRGIVASNGGVRDRLEPYLTTNHVCHKHFTPQELTHYPLKDVATYWLCENYPKAWGYGMNSNPLDLEEKTERKEGTMIMRDRTVFLKDTHLPQLPLPSLKPVSFGLHSVSSDVYSCPPASKTRQLFQCPVPPPPPVTKDTTQMETVSNMYKSMNSTYGSVST